MHLDYVLPKLPSGTPPFASHSYEYFQHVLLTLLCHLLLDPVCAALGALVNHSHKTFLSSPGGSNSQQLPHPLAPTSLEPLFLSALGVLGMALDRRLIQVWAFSRLTDRLWVCVNCWPLQGGALAEAEGSGDLGHFLILAGHTLEFLPSGKWKCLLGTVWRRLWANSCCTAHVTGREPWQWSLGSGTDVFLLGLHVTCLGWSFYLSFLMYLANSISVLTFGYVRLLIWGHPHCHAYLAGSDSYSPF